MKQKFLPQQILLALLLLLGTGPLLAQNVGVGEPTPNSKLDIVQTGATGNTVEVNHNTATNVSSAVFVANAGLGRAVNAGNTNTAVTVPVGQFQQFSTVNTAFGLEVDMDAASTAPGAVIFQDGSNDGLVSVIGGAGYGVFVQQDGSGGGTYNDVNGTGTIGTVNDVSLNGGIATYALFNGQSGNGYYFDSIATSGFGMLGFVNTTVPSSGGSVFGAAIGAEQLGVGHGILINHRGAAGRNAEFNVTNGNNTEPAIFAVHAGPGSAIVGQTQDNTITGTISVADFAYTGTDIADHIGVEGFSAPINNWGIGVCGEGGWYGLYSKDDIGAAGFKNFIIDHPADPTNKMIRHFSTESDEVLNMYRGMVQLDANGDATVQLPDYFQLINQNFSYQLTPVGSPVQPYVAEEIQGNTFKVSGAPNTKVSWLVLAERNDPYMQQNAHKRADVIVKSGERAGKYLSPQLYGAPDNQGVLYHANQGNTKAATASHMDRAQLNKAKQGLPQARSLRPTAPEVKD